LPPAPRGWLLRTFAPGLKYLSDLKTFCRLCEEGRRMGEWSRRAVFTSNVRDFCPPLSLIRVKSTALLCSLNILALPAQDEPTCICGRGCLIKPRLLLQSCRMPMWRKRPTPPRRPPVSSGPPRGPWAGVWSAASLRAHGIPQRGVGGYGPILSPLPGRSPGDNRGCREHAARAAAA
jgi:hypothetical protein